LGGQEEKDEWYAEGTNWRQEKRRDSVSGKAAADMNARYVDDGQLSGRACSAVGALGERNQFHALAVTAPDAAYFSPFSDF